MDNKINNFSIFNSIPINRPDIPFLSFDEYKKQVYSVSDFENVFKNWIGGGGEAVFTSSGKMSIYLLFKALNLKGNIITSPLTCSMALSPIVASGLELKFADINPETLVVDETIVEKLIDKNTAAIYIVHLGGVSPNMEYLRTIADKNNILLIEDCAQSLGSTYKNKKLGTYGDYACFSFAKNIWLSGGGAIYSKNTDTILQVRMLNEKMNEAPEGLIKYRFERDLLESKRGYSEEADIEYYQNYQKTANNANIGIDINTYFINESVYHKPSNLQATILCTQFLDIDFRNNKRNLIANTFIRSLSDCCKFQTFNHGWSIYSKLYLIPHKHILNSELIPKLFQNGVDAKHLTKSHGIHFQERFDSNPIFKKYFNESCLQKYLNIHDRILAIPISSKMQEEEINYIIQTIKLFTI